MPAGLLAALTQSLLGLLLFTVYMALAMRAGPGEP